MKNDSIFIYLFVFIFSTSIFAQKDTIWFDANWNKSTKVQSSYFRPAPAKKDNGYLLVDYYLSGSKQMEAFSHTLEEEKFEGEVIWYYENGKIMQTVNYKNNIPNGLRKNYHESGSLKSEYSYLDDKITGDWVSYHENAKLAESGKYEDDERTGIWKEYHKDGKLKGEGQYKEGKKIGVWKMYFYDGIEEE